MNRIGIISKIAIYAFLTILTLIVLIPFFWTIGSSLSVSTEIGKYGGLDIRAFIPEHITLANYKLLFEKYDMLRVLFNTVFVAATITILSLFFNSLAAYALARMDFKGKKVIFAIIVLTMIVPFELLVIPLYQVARQFHITDQYTGLIIPAMASALGIFYFRQFFLDIPQALEEAAIIDGASRFRIYWSIVAPLMKAPFVTMAVLAFLNQWDNFLWALTVINNQKLILLQVALMMIATSKEYVTDWGNVFAGAVLSAVPIAVLFIFIQKYYVQSIASVGIKG